MTKSTSLRIIARSPTCGRAGSRRLRDRLQGNHKIKGREGTCSPYVNAANMADEDLTQVAAELLAMRRRRDDVLPSNLFGEAAWDLLLSAYSSPNEIMQTKELCATSTLPEATAIRWLHVLEDKGFLEMAIHPIRRDQRATYFRLTTLGRSNVEQALEAMLHD